MERESVAPNDDVLVTAEPMANGSDDELGMVTMSDPEAESHAPETDMVKEEEERERAGLYLAALVALAVPSLIVLAFFLPDRNSGASAEALEQPASTGLDQAIVDVAEPADDDIDDPVETTAVETTAVETTAVETTAVETTAVEVEPVEEVVAAAPTESVPDEPTEPRELPEELANVSSGSIEVLVYNETPPSDGQYSFAIRLKNISTQREIDLDLFTVSVERADGEIVPTQTRFTHDTLPADASAIATVRAFESGSEDHSVVVSLGTVEVGRIPIETE